MKMLYFFFILFMTSLHSNSQKVRDISWYFQHYDPMLEANCFKIGNHSLVLGQTEVCLDKKVIIKRDSTFMFFLEVYSKKILIVSYYPADQAKLATGAGFRPKHRVEFISLDDSNHRWYFDLKGAFNSESIMNFDEVSGELQLERKIKGKKIQLTD